MTGIIGWQVFGRFVLNSSPSWSEQAALMLMIWYVFLAAAAGICEGFHIRITLFEDSLSAKDRAPGAIADPCAWSLSADWCCWCYGSQLIWLVRDHVIPRSVSAAPWPICQSHFAAC